MKYVEKHLTKHHLLHAPHKWFFAFLASPIHFAEVHYKNRYHLQFAHARKLFLFDMSLVGMLFTILGAFLFWSAYNPTVTDLVYLTISPSQTRILSGEYVTYSIHYKNNSPVRLTNAQLLLELPEGYVLDKTDPDTFDQTANTLDLGNVESGGEGTISLSGWFYGTPSLEDHIHAQIVYKQDGKTRIETKTSPHIVFLRGSLLASSVELQEQIIEGSRIPFKITLVNNSKDPLFNISFALNQLRTIGGVENISGTLGTVNADSWEIPKLLPDESAVLEGIVAVAPQLGESVYPLELAPALVIRGKTITQSITTKKMQVARPEARITARWENDSVALKPSETGRLTVTITNTGSIALEHGVIEIPLPKTIVNIPEAARVNLGSVSQSTLSITSGKHPALNSLAPGESRTIVVLIPILSAPDGGTDTILQPSVFFHAGVSIAPDNKVEVRSQATQLKVGTQIVFTGEIRYYTAEGDQLGRGPLPPHVGKETKYAALFTIRNTTSNISQGVFTAKLPSYVVWTGKTSVTQGAAPVYSASTRTVRWVVGSIPAHATAGIFFELSLTPLDSQIGTSPVMVTNAEVSGFDSYLSYSLTRSLGALDTALMTDPVGRAKGTIIQE